MNLEYFETDIWKNVMRYLSGIFVLINNFCDTNARRNFNLQLINTIRTSFVIIHDDANDNLTLCVIKSTIVCVFIR